MNQKSCVYIMESVINEANKQFGRMWVVDDEKYDILKQYCLAFDNLAKYFNATKMEFSVDDITMESTVSFGCNMIEILEKRHLFYDLMIRASQVNFKPDGEDIIASMTFPSIWYHV